ncbi:hypothetical protein [Reinekea sp.]|jgi:hypothetical protein|nr:hypothetical protein [Reinekea sp.]
MRQSNGIDDSRRAKVEQKYATAPGRLDSERGKSQATFNFPTNKR